MTPEARERFRQWRDGLELRAMLAVRPPSRNALLKYRAENIERMVVNNGK